MLWLFEIPLCKKKRLTPLHYSDLTVSEHLYLSNSDLSFFSLSLCPAEPHAAYLNSRHAHW